MFVILGSMRSGTTLLAQCLNAHPDLLVPDETDFIVPTAFLVNRIGDEALGRRMVADLIVGSHRYAESIGRFLTPTMVREQVEAAPYDVAEIVTALYAEVARVAGVALAGDKSPNDLQFLRVLVDDGFFNVVKVVHIVRDVRDVMVSMHKLGWIPRLRYGYPRFWSADNVFAANRLSGAPERYHFLRYEDLVRDPEGELTKVCEHLGVAFDPAMVDDERRRAASQHREMLHHARTFGSIDPKGIGAYKDAFDEESLAHAERLGQDGLRRFGYLP
ncbi:MAG: sulfotransferase [Acidimicrobiales bacterium]|nr:sulfotransferase [Acidimicrobiales bacterium]MCB1017635.1 sulfotransferase [Acidimicrobiales bacterium]